MKKYFISTMVCISVITSATAALAIQPALAYDLTTDSTLSSSIYSALARPSEQLTHFSGKNRASAYVGIDLASHTSDKKLSQASDNNFDLSNSSIETSPDETKPRTLTLQQMYGSTTLAGNQINLRGIYVPESAYIALICAGLVALPFARRFRTMLQNI